ARNGDVYWFAQINDTVINDYMELLKAQGFKLDEYRSKTGRWVYVKGEVTVIVEGPTQANNGNTLVTVEDSIVYFTKHPSVPVPSGSADKTAPADTGSGTTYSYVASTEINVQAYIALLVELGFVNDTSKTGSGVYVYTKNDVTVTLDTVAVSNYVQLNVKTAVQATVPTVFYQDFPDVPSLAVPFYQRNSIDVPGGYGFAYWYQVITAETMDSYTAMLKNMGYTVTGDNVGGYTCVKGDTTVKIDPVSVRVTRTNVIVQTTPPPQLTSFYARYPNAVPNFAFVLIEQYPFVEVQPTAGGTAGVWKYEHIAEGLAGDTKFEGFVKMYEARLKLEGFTLEPISGIYLNSDKEVAVSVEHIPTANSTGIKHVYIVTVSELGD
ncbi:MAG: hypothetical protein LBS19_07605, partial [Clostridiales bacterium]|nr:hypothetical protein [Clostridiales bacterium]